ncbi:alpha/beta fold hydrolase [Xanthomonas pisi]|uniref:alpha/beta fold hydrolase n=1 Tax=Xanthomonas pisi TaxID=56457 RepID=UPI00069BEC54|nr:alpha/beta hydrolase [Xanthomonas pisi]
MTQLVILPGLDGTALMLDAFTQAARPYFSDVRVIAYPPEVLLGYDQLEDFVRQQLGSGTEFILLGESFSGPVAMAIAASPPPGLIGLVLSTTFATQPVPLLKAFAGMLRFAPARLPMPILAWFLLGQWSTTQLEAKLRHALRDVAPNVLRGRAQSALRIDMRDRLNGIRCPTLCLTASHDRLLSPSAATCWIDLLPHSSRCDLAGPHLLLQTAPKPCAQVVATHFGLTATTRPDGA